MNQQFNVFAQQELALFMRTYVQNPYFKRLSALRKQLLYKEIDSTEARNRLTEFYRDDDFGLYVHGLELSLGFLSRINLFIDEFVWDEEDKLIIDKASAILDFIQTGNV